MSVYEDIHVDWTYEALKPDTPPSDFGPFESLFALWKSKCAEAPFPAWKDFDFEDFKGWHGWLIVEDVIPNGNGDVRFLLWGTYITELFQVDMTGKCLSEAEPGFFDPEETEWIERIVNEGIILRTTGPMNWQNRQHKTITTIELPMSEDGINVDKILCGVLDISD